MPAETSLIRRYRQWHYQTSLDGTRTQQEARVVLLTSRQHAVHLRSPQLVVLGTSLQKLLQLVAQLTSRKRSLQPAVVLAAPVTNKNERLLA